ncbi:hypothetical protein [Jiella pacifica]|uniref:Uncharacterized protein n=1 Tax=Jiella pacifica TaxID=2696469 RepID=A0A6N9SYQ5_9HYPH|nr:hypothetical protein [Jiella pacifica]NDW03951.1 hypothetical protein [Jiella pacifica]
MIETPPELPNPRTDTVAMLLAELERSLRETVMRDIEIARLRALLDLRNAGFTDEADIEATMAQQMLEVADGPDEWGNSAECEEPLDDAALITRWRDAVAGSRAALNDLRRYQTIRDRIAKGKKRHEDPFAPVRQDRGAAMRGARWLPSTFR